MKEFNNEIEKKNNVEIEIEFNYGWIWMRLRIWALLKYLKKYWDKNYNIYFFLGMGHVARKWSEGHRERIREKVRMGWGPDCSDWGMREKECVWVLSFNKKEVRSKKR